jgi:hypothetical protein
MPSTRRCRSRRERGGVTGVFGGRMERRPNVAAPGARGVAGNAEDEDGVARRGFSAGGRDGDRTSPLRGARGVAGNAEDEDGVERDWEGNLDFDGWERRVPGVSGLVPGFSRKHP